MSIKAASVRLDGETLERVVRMAEAMDRPRASLMAHAIKKFNEQEEWFIREFVVEGARPLPPGPPII